MTRESSLSRNWKFTRTLTGQVNKRHGKKHEWCGDHGRKNEIACSQSWSGFSGVEQL